MPELRLPVDAVRTSFLSAMEEFRAEGRGSPGDISALGREIREWGGRWSTPEGFGAYVRALRGGADERTPGSAGGCRRRPGGGSMPTSTSAESRSATA